ncbi:ABC transporter ATP-binding protein [Aneurinibacillus aneurinilyticus]|jgi:putative ABC transport system ATP-binding protein|nr:ABC transporter ATP-binding protein [Aneurinibacillus aneurinilyticus]MCI1692825.1 ABC transporter ATP-binding protein [Aneurinibacillus aneurinilyticus]MED0668821.1 ABC transporter ATP-binding protein [Aneurinibacillus aneurinilyticus]MED0708273.1 ABC transporter ATP-binding protein [Aneurinibacillus aneurinilyticus]MED0732370.1 ABC transporter ATP-binding protein [Aneurinibacillus aneurinilyticus]MED0741324.1 ABC transporter ATP-binding protein [Aneurinibacillus aneurinilyticus]
MKTILQAKNVEKVFGAKGNAFTALKNITLEIKEGEFVGVMGPSGAGKSTLLNIFSTIDAASSGEINIDGKNIVTMKEEQLSDFRRDKLGFIFQDYNLLDTLTVRENILLPLALSNVPVKEIETRVEKIADTFGIREILDKYPYHISGGQKQRAAASRAIVTNPSLILADEPTGALDSKSATSLLESLSALNENNKSTIMMVTHDAFAASFCKRIVFIKDGQLYKELHKEGQTRKVFFQEVLDVLASLGGGHNDTI